MIGVDLSLSAVYPPSNEGFEPGARRFLALLNDISDARGFNVPWRAQMAENAPMLDPIRRPEEYIDAYSQFNQEIKAEIKDAENTISVLRDPDNRADVAYKWGHALWPGYLNLNAHELPGDTTPRLEEFLLLVEKVVNWHRPMHLRFGPWIYTRDHHPLDKSRSGIGWIGWLPFDIAPSDVPEAEVVQPLARGTIIATQRAFWQAFPRHPDFSQAAIERAQEVEIRLNLLGVLPTGRELQAGTWGQ